MIYFIRAGETESVKIGVTMNVEGRLADLQTAHAETLTVMRTMDGGRSEERWLHQHYAQRHLRGEWFSFDESMLTVETPHFSQHQQSRHSEAFEGIRCDLLAAMNEAAPKIHETAEMIGTRIGTSKATIDAYRAGGIPDIWVRTILMGRAYPDFAREFFRIITDLEAQSS